MAKKLNNIFDNTAQWIVFDDPEDKNKTWVFDATFLLSNWTCIFGNGCKGILDRDTTDLGLGCCSHGAHIFDEDEQKRIERLSKKLPSSLWQFKDIASKKGIFANTKDGKKTRVHSGACIFLNRVGFPGGHGCALHIYAVRNKKPPLKYKPYVCWQLPLRFEDLKDEAGHIYTVLRKWRRYDWGPGGSDFYWWCTESPEAFVGKLPVYLALKADLIELCGQEIYSILKKHLAKFKDRSQVTPVALKRKR